MAQTTSEQRRLSPMDIAEILTGTDCAAISLLPKSFLVVKCIGLGLSSNGTEDVLGKRIAQNNAERKEGGTQPIHSNKTPKTDTAIFDIVKCMIAEEWKLVDRELSLSSTPAVPCAPRVYLTEPSVRDSVPNFSATTDEDAESWISNLEDIQRDQELDDETTLTPAIAKLEGTAKQWQSTLGKDLLTWRTWSQGLVEVFGKGKTIMTWAHIAVHRIQAPNESTAAYLLNGLKIAEDCPYPLSDQDKLSCVFHGFQNRSVLNVITTKFTSEQVDVTDAINTAIRLTADEENFQNIRYPQREHDCQHPDERRRSRTTYSRTFYPSQRNQVRQGGRTNWNSGQQARGRTCYRCGEEGHMRYDCPFPDQRTEQAAARTLLVSEYPITQSQKPTTESLPSRKPPSHSSSCISSSTTS